MLIDQKYYDAVKQENERLTRELAEAKEFVFNRANADALTIRSLQIELAASATALAELQAGIAETEAESIAVNKQWVESYAVLQRGLAEEKKAAKWNDQILRQTILDIEATLGDATCHIKALLFEINELKARIVRESKP